MTDLLIRNATVVLRESLRDNQSVSCENGKITHVGRDDGGAGAAGDEVIDASGCYLAPGFIDLHSHGLHRYLIDNGSEDLAQICRLLIEYGV